jgi:erythromycin esterase
MAENVAWLHDHAGSSTKIVLSAHNLHIANTTPALLDGNNLGALLRQHYKQQYLPIGTSFFEGSFNAFNPALPQDGLVSYTVGPPPVGSYDDVLGSVGLPLYLLDLRQTPAGPVTSWVQGPAQLRSIGISFDPTQRNFIQGSLQQWFDAVIDVQKTTASRPLA